MRRVRLLILALISVSFIACDNNDESSELGGREVTQQFLSEYSGTYSERTNRADGGEKFLIDRNGDIEILKIRSVGDDNNPAIPSDTVCSYLIYGQVRYVVELNEETRQRVDSEGIVYYTPQTHNLVFTVENISLTDQLHAGTLDDSGCQHFEKTMNANPPVLNYGMELFGDGFIRFHIQGNDDFVDGERGDATLDEVFERD